MPRDKDLKRQVRSRMQATGQRYTAAREDLQAAGRASSQLSGWIKVGSHPSDYLAEIDPDTTYDGGRVAVLRS